MTTSTATTLILLSTLLLSCTLAQNSDITEAGSLDDKRVLITVKAQSQPIRIALDYSNWNDTSAFTPYLKNQLVPAVVDYLQAALKIKNPLTSNITTSPKMSCSASAPKVLSTGGVAADVFVFFVPVNDKSKHFMAQSTICQSSVAKRPTIIRIEVNIPKFTTPSLATPLLHDANFNTLIHEFIHGFGMNGDAAKYFVDSNGNILVNPIKYVMLSGVNKTVYDLPPLTARLRNYFNCSTIPGLFMRQGSAHPHNRFFGGDLMVNGASTTSRITEIDLGFLEGTGWYEPDYTYAEPYFYGRNAGCGFYANDTDPSSYPAEYCTATSAVGCNPTGQTGGYCKTTKKLEGYQVYQDSSFFNCEDPKALSYVPFASQQVYGRGLGSKCFSGNLTTSKSASQASYCLTYNCTTSGTTTTLQALWGQTPLTCTKAGPISVAGYSGSFNCPDPVQFCNTIGKPFCRRNCLGRGTCESGKCVCKPGFTGTECGFTSDYAYVYIPNPDFDYDSDTDSDDDSIFMSVASSGSVSGSALNRSTLRAKKTPSQKVLTSMQ